MQPTNPIYAALAGFAPRQYYDMTQNGEACREENQRQMEARARREAHAARHAAQQAAWADAVPCNSPKLKVAK